MQKEENIEGNQNIGMSSGSISQSHVALLSAGGDIHYNVNEASDGQFFELDADELAAELCEDLPGASALLKLLEEHALLILAGPLEDKPECARQLAGLLWKRLKPEGAPVEIRERYPAKEPQRIEPALKRPAILLLPEVTPTQIVGYGDTLGKLRNLLRSKQCYAILTTSASRGEWGLEGDSLEGRLWCELSWEKYYGREWLTQCLIRHLEVFGHPLPQEILQDGPDGPLLVEGIPLASVVESLRNPSRIRYFIERLHQEWPIPPEAVRQILAQLQGSEQAIRYWYLQFRNQEQLLVLGLTLLDGLPDDLLFEGLELLVETAWRSADPLLCHFDYRDLSPFSAYFKRLEQEGDFFRVQCDTRENRRRILELAWEFQRRRLLAALPALTKLIRLSAERDRGAAEPAAAPAAPQGPGKQGAGLERGGDRDLRLSRSDTLQLHQSLVDSLSLVGLLSIEVVEKYFLDLATDPSDAVRHLAARALSTWRGAGKEEVLFDRLETWWRIATDYEEDHPLLGHLSRSGQDSRTMVRAAVALTIGYAARFDRANRMAKVLYELMDVLVLDRAPRVRQAFASTLKWAVGWHFRQLEPLLRTKVLKERDLTMVFAVAQGAAMACSIHPEEAFAILDGWRTMATADRRRSSPLLQEQLLATVALTYGFIQCEDGRESLSPQAIGARLRSMLVEEANSNVRHFAFFAIEIQAIRNFEILALILQEIVAHVSLHDRPAAVETLVRIYLHQRQRLPGGDRSVEIEERIYGVWLDSVRPLTEIEAALYSWIMDDSRPIAQQLAVDVFEAMAETRLEREERRLQALRAQQAPFDSSQPEEPVHDPPMVQRLPLLGWMAVYLAAPRKGRVQAILRPLLAEVISVQKRRAALRSTFRSGVVPPIPAERPKARVATLLGRWIAVTNETTKAVAVHLRRAVSIYRWRWEIIGAVLLALFLLYKGSLRLYHRLEGSGIAMREPVAETPEARGEP